MRSQARFIPNEDLCGIEAARAAGLCAQRLAQQQGATAAKCAEDAGDGDGRAENQPIQSHHFLHQKTTGDGLAWFSLGSPTCPKMFHRNFHPKGRIT